MNGNTYFTSDFIILCVFRGRKWRQQTRKPSHFGSHTASERRIFRGLQGYFDPHTSHLGTKKYPPFTKSRTCGDLKKYPFFREIRKAGAPPPPPPPPSVPECFQVWVDMDFCNSIELSYSRMMGLCYADRCIMCTTLGLPNSVFRDLGA